MMSSRDISVPLPALAAAAPLDHVEAVTIVREVLRRVLCGELPGVPSAHVIRLSESGELNVEGPVAADSAGVRRAVHLLETLLTGSDSPRRVPGALRLIVGRALGTLDLPSYPSLESFADALSRFAAIDPAECFCRIVADRPGVSVSDLESAAPTAPDFSITVSDIRRARRATGIALSELSRRCDAPAHLLRQLEWGYLENWPASHVGRRLIARYARAAGLDEQLVMGAVWPLLAESVLSRGSLALEHYRVPRSQIVVAPRIVDDVIPGTLVRIEPVVQRGSNLRRVVAALTIPALLAIGAAPALWRSAVRGNAPREETAAPVRSAPPPVRSLPAAQPSARDTDVVIATPTTAGAPIRTGGAAVRQQMSRPPQPAAKIKRSTSPTASKSPQARQKASRDKGPRKWGVWVLNKIGVRIVNTNTEQQNP